MPNTDVELTPILEEFRGVIDVADRRIAGILMAWARGGNFDLGFLLRSVYLQGIKDGADVEAASASVPKRPSRWVQKPSGSRGKA